ncbi:hypothetical protein Tco_0081539, partial [Tanacetum coccineum]
MPSKRTSAAVARVAAVVRAAAAAAPMTAAVIEQLIKARVSEALANHETLRNSINGHGDGSHNYDTRIRGIKTLKKMMTVKNCPRGEIKKLKIKLWNLKVKGTDVASYTLCFQELALMCGRMFPEESDEVERYVGGLPDMIWGNVMSYQPKTMEKQLSLLMIRWIKKSSLFLKDKLSRRESWSLMLGTIKGTNNKIRDRTLGGLTLLGL